MSTPSDSTQCIAKHPFDDRSADAVFRTTDNVNFYVHQLVLSLASPFFADMFSLKNHDRSQGSENAPREPIAVSESSGTFDTLLRFCYPLPPPEVAKLSHLELVLGAAIKYQVTKVIAIGRASLINAIPKYPSRVFAVACNLQLEEIARAAALGTTSSESNNPYCYCKVEQRTAAEYLPAHMGDMSAGVLYRLLQYRRTGVAPSQFLRPAVPVATTDEHQYECDEIGTRLDIHRENADIVLRSLDGVDFPFHRLLLQLSSAGQLIESSETEYDASSTSGESTLPIFRVGLTSDVLRDLLRTTHPSARYDLDNPFRLWRLAQVAVKFDMTLLVETLRKQAGRISQTRPLAVCLLAMEIGWLDEARAAAHILANRYSMNEYEPILEEIPACMYHSLLTYHSTCIKAVSEAVGKHAPGTTKWKEVWEKGTDFQSALLLLPDIEKELGCSRKKASTSLSEFIISARKLEDIVSKRLEEISLSDFTEKAESASSSAESVIMESATIKEI